METQKTEITIPERIQLLKNEYQNWQCVDTFNTGINPNERLCKIIRDHHGRIYLSGVYSDKIYVYSADGKSITQIQMAEGIPFKNAQYMTLNQTGEILTLVDRGNFRILSISTDSFGMIHSHSYSDSKKKMFYALEMDSMDHLYAIAKHETHIQLQKYSAELVPMNCFYNGEYPGGTVTSMHFHQEEAVFYILLYQENAIYRVGPNRFERVYQNDHGFLHYFTTDHQCLYITVVGDPQCQLQKITFNGKLVCKYKIKELNTPAGIFYWAPQQQLWVISRYSAQWHVLEKENI